MYRHAINTGYSGAWDWALHAADKDNDSEAKCLEGIHSL